VIIPPVRDYAPADMSNHLLAPVTSVLTTGITTTETGEQKLTATIRTASTTLTVFLDKLEADAWGRQLTRDAQRL
jgi:hypothetical protein